MEQSESNKNNCQNCRYYSQHFNKRKTTYGPVYCGHCLHDNLKLMTKLPDDICRLWEDIKIAKDERRKSIQKTLESMCEQLQEMAMILKDDAE